MAPGVAASLIEPGPLPFDEGLPEFAEAWSPGGVPPSGLEFLGAKGTLKCWLLPCPACLTGWVPIAPDGTRFGYRLAVEIGCSDGCDVPEVAWWHSLQCGVLPPPEPPDPDRARRYARACIRRILVDIPERPTIEGLRAASYKIGGWLQAGGIPADGAASALLGAAARAGLTDVGWILAEAMTAGRARPGRVPS
jgi:hypothetical protein